MRRTLTTAALVLALCCPAFAGIMHTPAPESSTAQEPSADGYMQNDEPDSLTEAVRSLLESVLALI